MKSRNNKFTDFGEYMFVVKKMYSLTAIKEVHEIPYTKKQTELLLLRLSKHYFKNKNTLQLTWIKNRASNYGGWSIGAKGKRIPFVELHALKKNKKKGIYGLRVGIVLHEFSHALTGYKYGVANHGKIFIKTFNKVLRFYYKMTQKVK